MQLFERAEAAEYWTVSGAQRPNCGFELCDVGNAFDAIMPSKSRRDLRRESLQGFEDIRSVGRFTLGNTVGIVFDELSA